jgi:hypothetical protein
VGVAIEPAAGPELAIAQAALALELDRVETHLERDQAVVELERGPGKVERKHVPVVEETVRDRPRAQPAVTLRIKSVIAVHRRGLQLHAVEDLAVVAVETSLERAVAEVAVAWEAAGSAAVVAGDAADGDRQSMGKNK